MCPADTKTHPFSAKLDKLEHDELTQQRPMQGDWLHIAQTHLGQAFATLRFSMAFV